MQSFRTSLNRFNPFKHPTLFTLAVMLPLPILLFSSRFPTWLPLVVLGWLVMVFLLYAVANGRLLGHTPADFPLYILLLLIPVNLWATPDLAATLPLIYALIANITLFWALSAQRNARWLPFTPWLYIIGSLGLMALTLLGTQFKLPLVPAIVFDSLPTVNIGFLTTDGFNPNLSAGLLALFILPLFVTVWQGKGIVLRLVTAVVLIMALLFILLLFSRGAVLGLAAALIVVTVLTNKRWLIFWAVIGIMGLVSLYFLAPILDLQTVFTGTLGTTFAQQTLSSRYEIWSRVLYLLQDFPLTGVGLGMVEHVVQILYPTFTILAETVNHSHNIYLQIGAEMGLLGLVSLLAFFLVLFVWLLHQFRQTKNRSMAPLALGLIGSLITFMVHGLLDVITSSPLVAIIVWGLFGLMAAIAATTTE